MPRIVHGEGPMPTKVAIVGEAPGKDEDRLGRPFVGASGQLLDAKLSSAGLFRQLCYVTNVVKERPPGNNIKPFIDFRRKKVITSETYNRYVEVLKEELERADPNVIVAVGNTPLYALTGLTGITKYRGSILESSLLPGRKVIPILHPAAALRQYIWRHYIQYDLLKVKAESEAPGISYVKRDLEVDPTYQDVLNRLEEYRENAEILAFDIEIVNEEVSHISFSSVPSRAICIPFYHDGRDSFDPEQELEIWLRTAELLENPDLPKVAHNASFDTTFLMEKFGIKSRNVHDTMIASAVLYPDFSKGLAFLTSVYTDIPYYKDEGKELFKHGVVSDGPSRQQFRQYIEKAVDGTIPESLYFNAYSALDSCILMEVLPQQVQELQRLGNLETYENQRSLLEPILFMNQRGIRVHLKPLRRRSASIKDDIDELQEKLNEAVGRPLNPNSYKQLMEYFYEEKKCYVYKHKGKPTTNEKALKKIAGKGFEEASIILQIRRLLKFKSTYLDVKLDDRNRLRYSINPVGSRFGRFSSGKDIFGRGTNVQNLPPAMRRYLGPDDDYIAYEIDLSQAENRIVAYLGNESRMINAFENNIDIHSLTACYLYNYDPEDWPEVKKWDKMGDEGPKAPQGGGKFTHRYWGKRSNHALNYNMSYLEASTQWEISTSEAKPIIAKYHSTYPGVHNYQRIIENELKRSRTLTNLFGRKYRFMDRIESSTFKEGFSYMAQSTVADKINRQGLIPLYFNGAVEDIFGPVELLAQIHDSIIFQIPTEVGWQRHAEVLLTIIQSLEEPLTSWHDRTFVIPCGVKMMTRNLKDAHEFNPGELTAENAATQLAAAYKALTKEKEKKEDGT